MQCDTYCDPPSAQEDVEIFVGPAKPLGDGVSSTFTIAVMLLAPSTESKLAFANDGSTQVTLDDHGTVERSDTCCARYVHHARYAHYMHQARHIRHVRYIRHVLHVRYTHAGVDRGLRQGLPERSARHPCDGLRCEQDYSRRARHQPRRLCPTVWRTRRVELEPTHALKVGTTDALKVGTYSFPANWSLRML